MEELFLRIDDLLFWFGNVFYGSKSYNNDCLFMVYWSCVILRY